MSKPMFSSLSVRNFRIYWMGMLISLVGSWIQGVAQSWLVFELTRSAFLLGLVGFLGSLPLFFFSLLGGAYADRISKRRIILFTQHAFMVLAFVLALLTYLKLIKPWHIMLIAVLNGVVMAFDAPSRQAMVVELVGKRHLLNAIALNSAAFNSARIIGPAIAGILVSVIGMSGCFFLNGISFLAVIIALMLIKPDYTPRADNKGVFVKDILEGLRFIRRNSTILILIVIVGIISLFGLSYVILMPVFADQVFKVGARGLGVLMSATGLGALVAALVLARLGDFQYKGRLLSVSCLVFSVFLVLFSLSRVYAFSLVALAVIGWSSVTATSIINTLLQSNVPDAFRGRVMSGFMFTFAGIMPFGSLLGGVLAQFFGVAFAVMASGIVCTVSFICIFKRYPQIGTL